METVVVERELTGSAQVDALFAAEEPFAWCLSLYRVTFLHTYVALDGARMTCVYRAPDAESVRATQRQAGMPVARAWSATVLGPGAARARPGAATVVVERELGEATTAERCDAILSAADARLAARGCERLTSHLARDGRRMLCVFQAPDAVTVRDANLEVGLPVSRCWTATVHPGEAAPRSGWAGTSAGVGGSARA